jgi:hypothetical protein
MKAMNNATSRHDWWWMETGFDNNLLAPYQNHPSWSGQSLAGGITSPATALEAAFHLAMLPFGQMYLALVVSSGNAAAAHHEQLVGAKVGADFDSDRGNIARRRARDARP